MFKYILILAAYLSVSLQAQEKIFVGISGGSGSGKSTLAKNIQNALPTHSILLSQDHYYKDFSRLSPEERDQLNFDHPDSIDFTLLKEHLLSLKNNNAIKKLDYDFKCHIRKATDEYIQPAQLVIVEGILIFANPEVRDLFDLKIYIDADEDIRLLRRMERDISHRNRTFSSVKEQYLATVKPMYETFIRPSKKFADLIVPHGGENHAALSIIVSKLKHELNLVTEPPSAIAINNCQIEELK